MIYMDVTSSCKSPMNTGVQRVVRELHRSLAALAPVTPLTWDPALRSYCTLSRREHTFLVIPFGSGGHLARTGDAEPGRRANPVPFWSKFSRRITHRWNRLDLPAAMTPGDALFVPEIFQDNRAAWLDALPALSAARRVGVCYDALPWRRPELMPAAAPSPPGPPRRVGMFYDALTQRRPDISPPARQAGFAEYLDVLGGFDRIVTISEESAADLRACWRERGRPDADMPPVTVFEWPVDHHGAPRKIVPPPASSRPSVLCVGTFEPRKNHLLLLEAAERVWRARGDAFELVLVGRTTAHWGTRVEAEIERLRCEGRSLRWLRHVDDATLRRAYDDCAFTVFPSLVEGLGLPILESLWHGRPCICGTNGALGEVSAAGGCLSVDQTDLVALASALERLLTDRILLENLNEQAHRRPFTTWDQLAQTLLPMFGLHTVLQDS